MSGSWLENTPGIICEEKSWAQNIALKNLQQSLIQTRLFLPACEALSGTHADSIKSVYFHWISNTVLTNPITPCLEPEESLPVR